MLLHATTCYYTLLQVTTCYYMLLHVTTCYYMLLPVTTCYYMLLHVTTCYYMLLHVSTCCFVCKVKCSRYRPCVAQRVGRCIALLFHDRGIRRWWVVSSTARPHFTPGKDPVPILQEAGWAPGPVWTGGKSCPNRDSIPDRPARSQSLYRLSYRPTLYTQQLWKRGISASFVSKYSMSLRIVRRIIQSGKVKKKFSCDGVNATGERLCDANLGLITEMLVRSPYCLWSSLAINSESPFPPPPHETLLLAQCLGHRKRAVERVVQWGP